MIGWRVLPPCPTFTCGETPATLPPAKLDLEKRKMGVSCGKHQIRIRIQISVWPPEEPPKLVKFRGGCLIAKRRKINIKFSFGDGEQLPRNRGETSRVEAS